MRQRDENASRRRHRYVNRRLAHKAQTQQQMEAAKLILTIISSQTNEKGN